MTTFSTFRPEYLPSLSRFWDLAQCDHIIFTDHLQYTKKSPLSTSAPLNGPDERLRIPVSHHPLKQPICMKTVDDHNNWRKRHLKTLSHTFHHFPYGYYYLPLLEERYVTDTDNLSDILISFLEALLSWLHFDRKIHRASSVNSIKNVHDFIDLWYRNLEADRYLTKQDVFINRWLTETELKQRRISYGYFAPFPDYHILQAYKDLSILHFLMQFGPEAGYLIRQYM